MPESARATDFPCILFSCIDSHQARYTYRLQSEPSTLPILDTKRLYIFSPRFPSSLQFIPPPSSSPLSLYPSPSAFLSFHSLLHPHHSPSSSLSDMGRSIELDDPLTLAIAPPADETPEARALRLQLEDEARRTNDEIDEMLRQERAALRKRKKPVKVLLLGQSESGKSTTLKSVSSFYSLLISH